MRRKWNKNERNEIFKLKTERGRERGGCRRKGRQKWA